MLDITLKAKLNSRTIILTKLFYKHPFLLVLVAR